MTGLIDLTYRHAGKWYVLDYKSNRLPGYDDAAMAQAMAHSEYDLQALIYTLALHRWLRFRLRSGYDYARDFGGIRYLFCRGLDAGRTDSPGIHAQRFSPELVDALDVLFGLLRTLDDALANTLRRLDPETPDEVLAAAALASMAVANGHAGFNPTSPRQLVDAEIAWPDAEAWRQQLAASRVVATPHSPVDEAEAAPLVLENGLLYLRRYREYERRLALQLQRIASQSMPGTGIEPIAPLFDRLFPEARTDDHQARAAALALRRALLLVTGGPGTGKTTTIARLLVLRIAGAMQAGAAPLRIALAAPTGRAAERMAESLRRAATQMAGQGIDAALLDALPTDASTLHRLLGTLPDSPRFRHHADNPLPFDIVVVELRSITVR